jgi:hypothetical protein
MNDITKTIVSRLMAQKKSEEYIIGYLSAIIEVLENLNGKETTLLLQKLSK